MLTNHDWRIPKWWRIKSPYPRAKDSPPEEERAVYVMKVKHGWMFEEYYTSTPTIFIKDEEHEMQWEEYVTVPKPVISLVVDKDTTEGV